MKHSEYVEVVKSLAVKAIEKSIVIGVAQAIPFLAIGIPNKGLTKMANWLAELIVNQTEMGIFFKYVDYRSDAQAKDFEAAMISNHKAQVMGTKEERDNAEKILMDSLSRLVSLKM